MEPNVRALSDQAFHRMHGLPFADLPGIVESPEAAAGLRMRYDACMSGGEPRIFALFPAEDLAQIPGGIRLPEPPGIGLPGSDIFFMKTRDGLTLYVDTDRQEKVWIEIMDNACDAGIEIIAPSCDLDMIRRVNLPFDGLSADVDPPGIPAFEAHGFEHVPLEVGIDLLSRTGAPEDMRHDPGIPGL